MALAAHSHPSALARGRVKARRQLIDLDREAGNFRTHDDAAIITSLTGIGDVVGAEFDMCCPEREA
jgi:hypothetical protein